MKYKTLIGLLFAILAVVIAAIFIPAYLIRPFVAQTKEGVRISYYVRTWAPYLTVILGLLSLVLAIRFRRTATHWFKKSVVVVVLLLTGIASWLSFQNYFEWMFNALPNADYVPADQVDFITGKDMVLTVTHSGEAVAYPVRLLAYHHLVHDRVGGKPIVATY